MLANDADDANRLRPLTSDGCRCIIFEHAFTCAYHPPGLAHPEKMTDDDAEMHAADLNAKNTRAGPRPDTDWRRIDPPMPIEIKFSTWQLAEIDYWAREPDEGGPRGTRTHNPRIKSPLLCQLS